jgi:signal peptidase I
VSISGSADRELRAQAFIYLIAAALRGGYPVKVRVAGTSMLPAIWPGDVLTVTPSHWAVTGDVVLMLNGLRLRAHRVVETFERHGAVIQRTRGDALDTEDPRGGEILGKVVERNGRPLTSACQRSRLCALSMRAAMRLGPVLMLGLRVRALIQRLGESWSPGA